MQELASFEVEVEAPPESPEKVVLTLTPSELGRLEITDHLGLTHHKSVTLVEVLKLLDASATVESLDRNSARRIPIGPVPDRVLSLDVLEAPRLFQVEVVGWIAPFEHAFAYGERAYPIRLPALVYRAVWNRKARRLDALKLFVAPIGEEAVTPETRLYRWPFSNVYDTASVCWPTMGKVELGLEEIPRRGVLGFLSVANNADLFGLGRSHNGPHDTYDEFLQAASAGGLKQEWLIPRGTTAAAGPNGVSNANGGT